MKKHLIILVVFFCFFSVVISIEAKDMNNNLLDNYNELELKYYNNELKLEVLIEKLINLDRKLKDNKNNFEKNFSQAKIYFLLGEIKKIEENEEKAIKYYEKSQKFAEKALERRENSDIYNMLGDSYIRLLTRKGAFYAVRNGQKTFDFINKAIELDENNYSAYNSLGIIYFEAPKIGGGDINKSIENFKKALESDDKIENFISYYHLAEAYKKIDKNDMAEKYFQKAKNIFPENYYIKNY